MNVISMLRCCRASWAGARQLRCVLRATWSATRFHRHTVGQCGLHVPPTMRGKSTWNW